MKLKADFLGTLYYAGTNKTVSSAFNEPALAEAVARLIGNCEVPGIEVASASALSITTRLLHISTCFKGYTWSRRHPQQRFGGVDVVQLFGEVCFYIYFPPSCDHITFSDGI